MWSHASLELILPPPGFSSTRAGGAPLLPRCGLRSVSIAAGRLCSAPRCIHALRVRLRTRARTAARS